MPLPDLLQWLGSARKSGTLQVERNRVRKWIQFQEGQILGCSSDDPPERLGQFLLSRGRVTEEQLRNALATQEAQSGHLGQIFVGMGVISDEELISHLEAKAEETIYSLFGWIDAAFRFHDEQGEAQPTLFPINLRVEDVLLRGMQRFDEMQRIRAVFHDPGIVLCHTEHEPPQEVLENNMARTLYEAIDGERTVAEILLHVHGSEYLVTKFLYELHRNEFVRIAGVKSIEPAESFREPVQESFQEPVQAPSGPELEEVAQPIQAEVEFETEQLEVEPAPDTALPVMAPQSQAAAPASAPNAESPAAATPAMGSSVSVPVLPGDVAAEAPADTPGHVPDEDPETLLDIPDVFFESSDVEAIEDSTAYQVSRKLDAIRAAMSAGEYDKALEDLNQLYSKYPDDESLGRLMREAEAAFKDKAYRHFLPAEKIPHLARPLDEIQSENLSPSEFFLLSRIDGTWDVKSIIQIAPLREIDALLTLKRLRESGIIDLRDP